MEKIIELIVNDFECNDEYIYDAFYEYLIEIFVDKYPEQVEVLHKHYFPNNSSLNMDDLYDRIKDDVVNTIIERNEDYEKYF